MTSALEASGPKQFVLPFTLIDGLAPIFAIFCLKILKNRKSAQPNEHVRLSEGDISFRVLLNSKGILSLEKCAS
jgi:hypothetical protein